MACIEPDCERPVVQSAVRCRMHLAEAMRREGETIPLEDPELAGMFAAAVQIVRTALAGLPQDLLDPSAPRSEMDMYALLDPDADWQLAQMALDLLGTLLSDEFGAMRISAPMGFHSRILLRLRVLAPEAVEEFRPRLRFALEAMLREVVGPDSRVSIAVEPAEESDAWLGSRDIDDVAKRRRAAQLLRLERREEQEWLGGSLDESVPVPPPPPEPAFRAPSQQESADAVRLALDFIEAFREKRSDVMVAMAEGNEARLLGGLLLCVDVIVPVFREVLDDDAQLVWILDRFAEGSTDQNGCALALEMLAGRVDLGVDGRWVHMPDSVDLHVEKMRRVNFQLAGLLSAIVNMTATMTDRDSQATFRYFVDLAHKHHERPRAEPEGQALTAPEGGPPDAKGEWVPLTMDFGEGTGEVLQLAVRYLEAHHREDFDEMLRLSNGSEASLMAGLLMCADAVVPTFLEVAGHERYLEALDTLAPGSDGQPDQIRGLAVQALNARGGLEAPNRWRDGSTVTLTPEMVRDLNFEIAGLLGAFVGLTAGLSGHDPRAAFQALMRLLRSEATKSSRTA